MSIVTRITTVTALLLMLCGCASYRFTSNVPDELRTLSVPLFENASGYPEIDAIVTQYVLREVQREGTFKIKPVESSSLKLLGKLVRSDLDSLSYDRNYASRTSEYRFTLTAEITLVERGTGKMLIENKRIKATTTFLTRGDMLTGLQDAYPRVSTDLSRAIVDTLLANW